MNKVLQCKASCSKWQGPKKNLNSGGARSLKWMKMEKSGRGLTAHPLLNSLGLAGMCMCFVQFSKEQIMKSLKRSKELDFDNLSSDPQFTRGMRMYIVPWIAGVDALAMLASKFMNLQMIDFFSSLVTGTTRHALTLVRVERKSTTGVTSDPLGTTAALLVY